MSPALFYVYYLRRPDKEDPLEPGKGQPFYAGKGSNGRTAVHRQEASNLLHKPGRKSIKINIIHTLWKQGLDFSEDIILCDLTEKEAFDIEVKAIETYGRINNGIGCLSNLTDGGEGQSGYAWTEKSRQKLSAKIKGVNHCCWGKHPTEETRQKMSRTRLELFKDKTNHPAFGKHASDETKEKLSKDRIERYKNKNNHPMFGKHHSEEAKQKQREAMLGNSHTLGYSHTEEAKRKISISISGEKNGNFGRVFTEDHRRKISNSKLGRALSDEHKIKIGKAVKGEKNGFYGRIHTEETKQKIRTSLKSINRQKHTEETKQKMRDTWQRKKEEELSNAHNAGY